MTLLLLLAGAGIAGPVPVGSGVAGPDGSTIHVEFSPTTDPYEDPVWVDVSAYVRAQDAISITRGRSYELDDFQTGTCSFTLDNRLLHFDQDNASSPFADGLEPARYWRVMIDYDGVVYPRFHGFNAGWPQRYDISKREASVPVSLTDAFAFFAQSALGEGGFIVGTSRVGIGRVGGGVAGTLEHSGERIATVLDLEGWPASRRDLAMGVSLIATGTPSGDPLSYMKTVEKSEDGFLFVARNGAVTFLDRHARYSLERMTTSQATFSDDGADSGYADVGVDRDWDRVFNDFRFTRDGGEEQVAEDTESIRKYRRRKGPGDTVLLTSDAETKSLAQSLLSRYKAPQDRLPTVAVRPMRNPATALPAWLGRELLDACTVEHTPMNLGPQRVFDVLLEGYTETFTSFDFNVSASFAPRFTATPFIVGDATYGVVGGPGVIVH